MEILSLGFEAIKHTDRRRRCRNTGDRRHHMEGVGVAKKVKTVVSWIVGIDSTGPWIVMAASAGYWMLR